MADHEILTLTVLQSRSVARADGRAAIVLTTIERGPIAFEINLETIEILRRELATIERILRAQVGKA